MTPLLTTLTTIFPTREQACSKLNISETKYDLYTTKNICPMWLAIILRDKYRVSPLYIHGYTGQMFLEKNNTAPAVARIL
jgi:hypothetical protein